MDKSLTPADKFSSALKEHAPRYDVQLSMGNIDRLREYYEHVMAWNPRQHLVAPCSPAEFATRHVLESLLAVSHIPDGALVVDIGSGAGLPIIPCMIVRPDLRATLIESSPKKAVFLREVSRRVGAHDRAAIIADRFENLPAPAAEFVTCRALERFVETFPKLVEWSPPKSTLLLFGGNSLRKKIDDARLIYQIVPIPQSERRFLFVIRRRESRSAENMKSFRGGPPSATGEVPPTSGGR